MCDKCENEVKEFGYKEGTFPGEKEILCGSCGKIIKENFRFCPYCGGESRKA